MSVRFECPTCKTSYDVDDDLAGKMIMCRGCQKRGQVRAAGASSKAATTTATTAAPATATSVAKPNLIQATTTRRESMAMWVYGLLAVGSITTGAVLARTRVLRNISWGADEEPPDTRRRKGPRTSGPPGGPPPGGPPPAGKKGP
jgi:hypothetical protein